MGSMTSDHKGPEMNLATHTGPIIAAMHDTEAALELKIDIVVLDLGQLRADHKNLLRE